MQLHDFDGLWFMQRAEMLEAGVEPSVYTFNAKVKTECIVGDFESACETIVGMMEGQLKPDVTTWQAMLAAAHRCQRSDVVDWVSCTNS